MNKKNSRELIEQALMIDEQNAKDAGMLGFMARTMVQASLPYREVPGNEYIRKNGNYTLTLLSPSSVGLPYGAMPRLLIAWMGTEAVRTQSRELELGRSMRDFLNSLGLKSNGGARGSITRLKEQSRRLFRCTISCDYLDEMKEEETGFRVVDHSKTNFWWHTVRNPDQGELFDTRIVLSDGWFQELVNHAVPIDLRALKALKKSPMAIDIYCWLTYRYSYLNANCSIPWPALQMQFGSSYPQTKQGSRDFKKNFILQLKAVKTVYPRARLDVTTDSLILRPSFTHISHT